MAYIQPFAAVTFDPTRAGPLEALLCPPYDVISPALQDQLLDRNPHNIVRLELGKDQPGDGTAANRYTRAHELLEDWLAQGVLREDSEPAFYVYEQAWEGHCRRSFFAAVRLAPWSAGEVLPHEQTLSGPKVDRLELMRHTGTNLSPVMGLFDDPDGTIGAILGEAVDQAPLFSVTVPAEGGGDERHTVWKIASWDAIASIQETLSTRPIFIADGHHRYETALTYRDERRAAQGAFSGDEPWNYVLMALTSLSDPGLVVLPTHRLVRAPGLDPTRLLEQLSGRFAIETIPLTSGAAGQTDAAAADIQALLDRLGGAHRIAMVLQGQKVLHVLKLTVSPEAALAHLPHSKPWRELDVAQLHYLVLAEAMGIPESEWKGGKHIVYTRNPAEVLAGLRSGEFQAGFFLDGTPVEQIKRVSLAGDVMPQKSTYFYPKVPTGLVIHRLDEQAAAVSVAQP